MSDEDDVGSNRTSDDERLDMERYPTRAKFQYGSDPSILNLFGRERSFLLQGALEKMPVGFTISEGTDYEGKLSSRVIGFPGITPVFFMAERDISREGIGKSYTLGIGEKWGGYATLSSMNGKNDATIGLFYSTHPKAAVLGGISLSELARGDVKLEFGGLVSGVVSEKGVVVEVTYGVRPAQLLDGVERTVGFILSPLSDFRNFQDPLIR
jgi:hypothetical protein